MTDAPPPTGPTDPPTAPTTGGPSAAPPVTRIGSAERQQAMDALDVHMSAGRLDPDEYGERVAQASIARTTADLTPLFTDLPLPHAGPAAGVAVPSTRPGSSSGGGPAWSAPSAPDPSAPYPPAAGPPAAYPSVSPPAPKQRFNGREPLGGRIGEVAVATSPFLAVILFFVTGTFWDESWLVFLLIPLVGVVVYGHDWHDHDRDDRRRDRRRR